MSLVWIATLSLGGIGAISAIILYLVAQKFKVYEDPRNGQVEAVLPGANCGGCGFSRRYVMPRRRRSRHGKNRCHIGYGSG